MKVEMLINDGKDGSLENNDKIHFIRWSKFCPELKQIIFVVEWKQTKRNLNKNLKLILKPKSSVVNHKQLRIYDP